MVTFTQYLKIRDMALFHRENLTISAS